MLFFMTFTKERILNEIPNCYFPHAKQGFVELTLSNTRQVQRLRQKMSLSKTNMELYKRIDHAMDVFFEDLEEIQVGEKT
jgi:hypothetical protein